MSICLTVAHAQYTWTGSENNVWGNGANWAGGIAPPTDGSAEITLDGDGSVGDIVATGVVRYGVMSFSGQNYTITTTHNIVQGSGVENGILVDGVDVVLTASQANRSIQFNAVAVGHSGALIARNGGSLTLNAVGGFQLGGTRDPRVLKFDGDGTIILNGAIGSATHGNGFHLFDGFSGHLRLNTGGSTTGGTGRAFKHEGSGTVELMADDAIGTTLPIQFLNAAARIQAGGGARTLVNSVEVGAGFIVSGENSLTFSDSVDFGSTNSTINVEEPAGRLVLSGELSGTGLAVVTFDGAGVTEISGDNTSTLSHTVLVEGGLQVSNATGSATGSGPLQIGTNGFIFDLGEVVEWLKIASRI